MSTSTSRTDAAGERLHRFESLTDTSLAHLDVEELLNELLDRARELLQADTAAALLLDASGHYLVATAARGLEEQVWQGARVPLGQGLSGRIAVDKRPVIIDDVSRSDVSAPFLRQRGIHSVMGVPLLVGGTVIGVMHVGTRTTGSFSDEDVELLQIVADRVALATQASASRVDRAAATALQRSLIPTGPPEVAGYKFAARYVAGQGGGVGGDWYDVFVLPSGAVGIAIGDVVGAGFAAAVVMGRLRSTLRSYALDHNDPGEVLRRVDRKMQHFEPGAMATMLYAVIEARSPWLRLSVAGHPVPVLALPDRPATLLDLPIDLPIGVRVQRRRRTTSIELPPGVLACFYTDGLVERRHSTLDAGLERLRTAVTADPAESVCANVMNQLVGHESPDDDIAVLTMRRDYSSHSE